MIRVIIGIITIKLGLMAVLKPVTTLNLISPPTVKQAKDSIT